MAARGSNIRALSLHYRIQNNMRLTTCICVIFILLCSCSQRYGEWSGDRVTFDFHGSERFWILTVADFATYFPGDPNRILNSTDQFKQFSGSHPSFEEDTPLPLSPGDYYIAFECGTSVVFQEKFLSIDNGTHEISFGCSNQ